MMNAFQEKDRLVWELLSDPDKLAAFEADIATKENRVSEQVSKMTSEDWDHFLHGTEDGAVTDLIEVLDKRLESPASA